MQDRTLKDLTDMAGEALPVREAPYIIQWAKDMSANAKTGADAYNYHQLADQLEAVIKEQVRKAKLKERA